MTALSAALVGSVSYGTSNDALLDLLVKKGVLTDSEATAVAAELKEAFEFIGPSLNFHFRVLLPWYILLPPLYL